MNLRLKLLRVCVVRGNGRTRWLVRSTLCVMAAVLFPPGARVLTQAQALAKDSQAKAIIDSERVPEDVWKANGELLDRLYWEDHIQPYVGQTCACRHKNCYCSLTN